jgi:outer membrane protein TolC
LQNLRIAQLQEQKINFEETQLKSRINTEYQTALANYKSDYVEWITLRNNVTIAREVYEIIRLQYKEGIKTYVDVMVAEVELRIAEINNLNALYLLLSSKLDLQRALGQIEVY